MLSGVFGTVAPSSRIVGSCCFVAGAYIEAEVDLPYEAGHHTMPYPIHERPLCGFLSFMLADGGDSSGKPY